MPTLQSAQPGHCYVVATPIGNIADISPRARHILATASAIVCEDTRTTGNLLQHIGIEPRPLIASHEHNERDLAPSLCARLSAGESLAIVSDAGTPTLSDPGFRLVRECRRLNLPVIPIPGACAAITALSASGLPTNAFFFAGFLPPKSSARLSFLEKNRENPHTICLYESTHRIDALIEEVIQTLGPTRVIALARELTKLHETFLVGTAEDVRKRLKSSSTKGEFVLLIAPADYIL